MDPITVNKEIITRPADHEIFLSFTNDEDACTFYDWWQSVGEKLFIEHAEAREALAAGDDFPF